MTVTPVPAPKRSSAWNWPAEWSVERAFWREVATRTIAGVLTVIILSVPGLLYALGFGILALGQVLPILIGISLFLVISATYVVVLRAIRRSERRKFARALEDDSPSSGPALSSEDLLSSEVDQRQRLLEFYSRTTRERVRQAGRKSGTLSILATIGAAILPVAIYPVIELLTGLMW